MRMQCEDNSRNTGTSIRRLLLSGVAAAMLATSSLAAHATNINLAVASNFYGVPPSNSAVTDLIAAFVAANPGAGYTVTVVDNGATATLASHITTGNTRGVDLFLAADVATPWQLYNSFATMITGAPFDYAIGYLAMLSGTTAYNVSCDTGSCGYDVSASYTSVAIATPTLAPYGQATKELLWNAYGIDLASPPVTIHYYTNITGPLTAVQAGTDPVGFIALSAVCSAGSYPTGSGITANFSAAAFNPNDVNASPIVDSHKPIGQGAIRVSIGTSRSGAQNTELEAFVAFIQDFTVATSSLTSNSPMMTVLKKYCYSAPHQ